MISSYVVGDAEVAAKLDRIGAKAAAEMKTGIERLTIKLQNKVRSEKLSGQVLHIRTGRLINSIERDVAAEGGRVVGTVSTPVEYARAQEYGFQGSESVKAHLRTIKEAFGRPIDPVQVQVGAFTRQMKISARSFLRSALQELDEAGTIRTEIQAAVDRASQ